MGVWLYVLFVREKEGGGEFGPYMQAFHIFIKLPLIWLHKQEVQYRNCPQNFNLEMSEIL